MKCANKKPYKCNYFEENAKLLANIRNVRAHSTSHSYTMPVSIYLPECFAMNLIVHEHIYSCISLSSWCWNSCCWNTKSCWFCGNVICGIVLLISICKSIRTTLFNCSFHLAQRSRLLYTHIYTATHQHTHTHTAITNRADCHPNERRGIEMIPFFSFNYVNRELLMKCALFFVYQRRRIDRKNQ